MFNGDIQISFESTKNKEELIKIIEQELENIGSCSASASGGIEVSGGKYSGAFHKTTIDGRLSERDNRYTIQIEFKAKPSVLAWVICICAFPFGLAVLYFPNAAKGDVQRKLEQAFNEIKHR